MQGKRCVLSMNVWGAAMVAGLGMLVLPAAVEAQAEESETQAAADEEFDEGSSVVEVSEENQRLVLQLDQEILETREAIESVNVGAIISGVGTLLLLPAVAYPLWGIQAAVAGADIGWLLPVSLTGLGLVVLGLPFALLHRIRRAENIERLDSLIQRRMSFEVSATHVAAHLRLSF